MHIHVINTLLKTLAGWALYKHFVCVCVYNFGVCVRVVTRTYPPSPARLQHPHRWFVWLYSSCVMCSEKASEEKQLGPSDPAGIIQKTTSNRQQDTAEVGFSLQIRVQKLNYGPRHQGHQAALLIPLCRFAWTWCGAESQTTGRHGDALREPPRLHPGDQINVGWIHAGSSAKVWEFRIGQHWEFIVLQSRSTAQMRSAAFPNLALESQIHSGTKMRRY